MSPLSIFQIDTNDSGTTCTFYRRDGTADGDPHQNLWCWLGQGTTGSTLTHSPSVSHGREKTRYRFINSHQDTFKSISVWAACLVSPAFLICLKCKRRKKKKKSRQRWRWALQTPQPGEMENSWGSVLPQCRPAPRLLLSGSNQTALGLSKDPVPLFISTVARTPLIGILQLGHGHCLSSAVKSLRLVNVELWSPQMPDWAAPLRYLNASISISSQTRIRLLWIHICCRALCVCWRQCEGTPSKEIQLLFLFMKSKNPKMQIKT